MKKLLFLIPCLFVINVMAAQGIDKYGQIVTDGTLNTLKVGTVTYPNTHNTTAGQLLTTDGVGVASWATPSKIATVYFKDSSSSLTDSDSGKIIYLLSNISLLEDLDFPLSIGFTCTFINFTGGSVLVDLPSDESHYFFNILYPNGGSTTLSIPAGGTVLLNIVIISGVKRYYVSGDILNPT